MEEYVNVHGYMHTFIIAKNRHISYLWLSPNVEALNNTHFRSQFQGVRNLGSASLGPLPHCLPQRCRQDANPVLAGSSEPTHGEESASKLVSWLLAALVPQRCWVKFLTARWPTFASSSLPRPLLYGAPSSKPASPEGNRVC